MKVEVQQVTKTFDTVRAVDGLSFGTGEGKILGLLGPNGAGKSTTIRMIMNILIPDEGKILFDGRSISAKDKDRIGYLPEERGLYKKAEINDLLLYLSSLKGRRRPEAQEKIDLWLQRFELKEWKNRKIEDLSKGMSQKIQFIAAVAHVPEIVFLDEPFAGLDPVSTEVLLEAIVELQDGGTTILFSTHLMDQAEKLCHDILLINHGREVLSGPVEEIKARFGKNAVRVEFDGDIGFLSSLGLVNNLIQYPRWIEADIAPEKTADELLQALVGKVSVKQFQVLAPSLHKIFVETVRGKELSDE